MILDKLLESVGIQRIQSAVGSGDTLSFIGNSSKETINNNEARLKAYTSWVYASANAVARDVAQSQPILLKNDTELESHPILDIFDNPNTKDTFQDILELTTLQLQIFGNSFWHVITSDTSNKPIGLSVLNPLELDIRRADNEHGYQYIRIGGRGMTIYSPDEIVHHRYPALNCSMLGTSIVSASAIAVKTDYKAGSWNLNFFDNHAVPANVIESEKPLTKASFKRLKKEWHATFGGHRSNSKTAFLDKGLSVKTISMSQRDMDYLDGRRFNRDEILTMFGVSGAILGIQESSNRATAEAADYIFARRVIRPNLTKIYNRLQKDFVKRYYSAENLKLTFDDPVQADRAQITADKTASVNKWRTINEIRQDEGLPAISGGEVIYQPFGQVPLGETLPRPEPRPEPED